MRIKSPVGEYDYEVTALRLRRDGLEVDGRLGQWETTMVVEPKDLAPLAKGLGVVAALALVLVVSRRR
jgi:hypothetical protein